MRRENQAKRAYEGESIAHRRRGDDKDREEESRADGRSLRNCEK